LRLAAVTTAGEHVLPRVLAAFRDRYPGVEVGLEVGNRSRVWDLLEHREVDLAIGGRPPANGRFVTLATRPNVLVVVVPPAGPAGGRPTPLNEEQLGNRVWLLREPGSGTRATVEELFEALGIAPPTLTLGSNGAIRESVRAGLGVTLISRDAVARELERGALVEWRGAGLPWSRAWHLVGRVGEGPTPTARLFLGSLVTDPLDGWAPTGRRSSPRPATT
ncbi:MAG: LysR substrate-binding domain-containing protein, partial [Acidimicrobiales bacterium]